MKYIEIENLDSEKLVMHMACKECDAELTGLEKFCPQCGRKLVKKEKGIPRKQVAEILDQHILDGDITPVATEHRKSLPTDPWAKGDQPPKDLDCETPKPKEVSTICLHGDHRPESCGHCTKAGACSFTTLLSIPPKYNMCPFRGSGYIDCKDA